ncbi:hypothetical protein [Paenibacillus mendelii]|uniref:Lipoprotein n=1 Tax=Paenibacillus mendelii TaxID=206163 RepID=A0ABV6J630_9BACL|nr:hypothetical protein [Paenibacillus mendelii]MCQ6559952.1 hypothetical protein [Paenibacillus mendelii]
MVRVVAVLLFLSVFLVGCGNPVSSFEGEIDKIQDNEFRISCSDAANKGKKGDIIDIGYLCNVQYTNQTLFRDIKGESIKAADISLGSTVNVILEKPVDIRKNFRKNKPFVLTAKEIVLLTKGE